MADELTSRQDTSVGAELRLKMEEDAFYLERSYNEKVWREAVDMRQQAIENKRAYDKLLESKFVRCWLKMRALLGKPYRRLDKEIPPCSKGEPFEVHKENRPLVRNIERFARAIPSSNGSAYYEKADLKVGIITDDFMYHYYQDAMTLVELNPLNYVSVIDSGELDFVLYVSGWRGLGYFDGIEEPERAYFYGKQGVERSVEVLRYAKEKGLLVIFQTIEDPPNYEHFLPIAREADVVFTAAKECVEQYQRDLGHDRVHTLLYGINPHLQNPIGAFGKQRNLPDYLHRSVLFAGAWYPNFAKRCEDTRMLLDGVADHSSYRLYLADRNLLLPYHAKRAFPREYDPYLIPPIAHEILQRAHKLFDFTINVSTVTESETMCAMRAYEVQAMGGLLLTNYALSTSTRFPGMMTPQNAEEIGNMLGGYTDAELDAMRVEGLRDVYSHHTVYDRLNEVLTAAGRPAPFAVKPVYVVCENSADASAERLEPVPGMHVISPDEARALSPDVGFMVRLDEGAARYGRFFLVDMLNAMKFVDVAFVRYVPEADESYCYLEDVPSASDCLFDLSEVSAASVLDGALSDTLPGFAVFAPVWGRACADEPKELAVIVLASDDAAPLWRRCFRSLLRSFAFSRMRVYLACPPDSQALSQARQCAEGYANVVLLENCASLGEALRATDEPFVAFVDSSDEAVGDGLARMLALLQEGEVDFVAGSKVYAQGGRVSFASTYDSEDLATKASYVEFADGEYWGQGALGCVFKREALSDEAATPIACVGQPFELAFADMVREASRACCLSGPIYVRYGDHDCFRRLNR